MLLVRPMTVDDTALVSSTAPETAPAAWSSSTTYALGGLAAIATTHNGYDVYFGNPQAV